MPDKILVFKGVDHTWAKVNKDGSPDKRFKGNRQLPICRYGLIQISADSGMDIRLCCSNYNLIKLFIGNPAPALPEPPGHPNRIMHLPGQPGDVLSPDSESLRKVVIIMSTSEELSLIVSTALLIVAILNFTHKK